MECPCCGQHTNGPIRVEFLKEIKLPQHAHEVLCSFVDQFPKAVRKSQLVAELYSLRPDGGPSAPNKNVAVYISQIRNAIRPLGWNITFAGSGRYKLIPDTNL